MNSFEIRPPDRRGSTRRRLILIVGILLAVFLSWLFVRQTVRHRRLVQLRQLYDGRQFDAACRSGQDMLQNQPLSQEVLALTGLAAHAAGRSEQALQWLDQLHIKRTSSRYIYEGWLQKAAIHREAGHLIQAVDVLQTVLAVDSTDVLAIRRLSQIQLGVGNQEQSVLLLQRLVKLGHASPHELMTLAAGGDALWSLNRIQRLRRSAPDDRLLILAEARRLIRRNRPELALELLDQALESQPRAPQLVLQRLELSTSGDAIDWSPLQALPESARLWLFLARQAEHTDPAKSAACSRQAVLRCPFLQEACSYRAHILMSLGAHDESRRASGTAQFVRELTDLCSRRDAIGGSEAERCVQLLQQMNRTAEVIAWCRAHLQTEPDSEWAKTALQTALNHETRVRTGFRFADSFNAPLNLRDEVTQLLERRHSLGDAADSPASVAQLHAIQLDDVAAACGLNVRFYNGADAQPQRRRMHEFTGGGVGVLDLDGDDWPDLVFPQGSDDPLGLQPPPEGVSDQLFRNLRGRQFVDVSEPAGLSDSEFGQGVAIGDVNNDGFDDIYIANTSRNALWINQGDGTFLREDPDPGAGCWTISAAVVDVNRDSVPDLYDVNYVGGDRAFTMVCDADGEQRVCGPTDFPPEPDVLWTGDGSGSAQPSPEHAAVVEGAGRGMGIVAGDLLHNGTTQLMIANDESANFFLEATAAGSFRDTASLRGLATSGNGELQGSMGIAAGRAAGGQRIDLFITNYYGEANCLHVQTEGGFFPDLVSRYQLEQPGRGMLGFGTQFLDADGDGDDDLFVANGHLDNFLHQQIPYQMHPQLFQNINGRFAVQPRSSSDYLATPVLGRAAARLDWNRDGRMDLCVTHLDRPVALLQNQLPGEEHSLLLSYVGTTQSRDAVGTVLLIGESAEDDADWVPSSVFPVLAGDGYECSNEHRLHLVVSRPTEQISISDGRQSFTIPVSDSGPRNWKIVEGSSRAWWIPH